MSVLFVGLATGKRHQRDGLHWEITSCQNMLLGTPGDYHSVISRHKQGLGDSCWEAEHQQAGLILPQPELLGQRLAPAHGITPTAWCRHALQYGLLAMSFFFFLFFFFFNSLQRARCIFIYLWRVFFSVSKQAKPSADNFGRLRPRKVLMNRLCMLCSVTD